MAFVKKNYPTGNIRGIAVFPHLNKPDDKFDKVVFKVNLDVPAGEAADLVSRIEAMLEALKSNDAKIVSLLSEDEAKRLAVAFKTKKLKPADQAFGPRTDKEGNVDENTVTLKFKKNGNFKDQKTGGIKETSLPLFDKFGKELTAEVWGGSDIVVKYRLMPWVNAKSEYGVKLAMDAVLVKELRQGGGGSASSFGFDVEADDSDGGDVGLGDLVNMASTGSKAAPADDADGDF